MRSAPGAADLNHPAVDPAIWPLDPETVFLNHGSFGSCPRAVLEFQRGLQAHLERQPVQFFVRELEGALDQARTALSHFVGAEADDVVFVQNATAGVNTVLRSLRFQPGDELLVTNHEYNACRNALEFVAAAWKARVVVAEIPFPVQSTDQIAGAILERVTARTRLALLDHVTSQTGLVLPVNCLATELQKHGVDTLVDGAHAPGMLALNLAQLGATYYTGNCHKWVCAPKGAGFLYIERNRQPEIRPLAISHGANSQRIDRSRFQIEFGWTGTWDASAFLAVPEALRTMEALLPGGWPEIMHRNRHLALKARSTLCEALGTPLPCPEELIGCLASIPLADAQQLVVPTSPLYADPLQDDLRERFGIEVPVIPWPEAPKRVLRISAQLYNSLPQYERLAHALVELMPPNRRAAPMGASGRSPRGESERRRHC
jgi:isopenicillin-N epimerase